MATMEDKERQKKVLAGKEKFAKLMKKKKNTPPSQDIVHKNKRKEEDEENSGSEACDEFRDTDTVSHGSRCDSLTPGSVEGEEDTRVVSVDLVEKQSMLSTEQDIFQAGGKPSAFFTCKPQEDESFVRKLEFDENADGDHEQLPCSDHDIGVKLKEYHKKIQEFQSALRQRDDLIAQLSTSLQTTIAQRDVLQSEASLQSDALIHEIETLKLQLQQANEFLQNYKGKNGISVQELLEVKNELVALQQSFNHQQKHLDETCQELASARAEANELQRQQEYTMSEVQDLKEDQSKSEMYVRDKDVENERLKVEIQRVSDENRIITSNMADLELCLVKLEEVHVDQVNALQAKHLAEFEAFKEEQQSLSLERKSLVSLLDNEVKKFANKNAMEGGTLLSRMETFIGKMRDSNLQRNALETELHNTKLLLSDAMQDAEAKGMRLQELEDVVKTFEDLKLESDIKENLELVNQRKVIDDLKQDIDDKESRIAIYAEKLIALEAQSSSDNESKAEIEKLESQLADATNKIEELVQEARIISQKNANLEEEIQKLSHQQGSGAFAAAVADLLDRCNMSDGSKLWALAKLAQDDTEGPQSWQASRDASIEWAECPSLPDSVGGDRLASGELDVDELWRMELEHLLADLEAVETVESFADAHAEGDGPRARKDMANLKMKMRHLAGCFISVLREKSTLEALVRDLKKAIELQQMARNKVELNEQEEKLGKGDFALEHGPWEQEKQMLELCIADLNSKNESHITARENLALDIQLLREECAQLRQDKLLGFLNREDLDNAGVESVDDVVQRVGSLEKDNVDYKDKLLTANENNAILKSQVDRLKEALTVRGRQETQLRQELDCCYARQRSYWSQQNAGAASGGDGERISDMQQSLADFVDQVEKKAINFRKGYTLGADVDRETADFASKDLESLSEYLVPYEDEDNDENSTVDLTEKMVNDFVQRTVQQALEEAVVPENQSLKAKLASTLQQHDEEMRKVNEQHAAQLEELTKKMDDLKTSQHQELEQERGKIREEIINEYVTKFHVITQELETNHKVAVEELQKSVNHENCMKTEDYVAKVKHLTDAHQQQVMTLEKEFQCKVDMVKAELVQIHNSQMEALLLDVDAAKSDVDVVHNEQVSQLKNKLYLEFEQERASLVGSHNSEIERLCQEHEDLDNANAHLRMLLTNIVRTYFIVAKNVNKEFLSMLRNEAGSAGWDTTAGRSEFNDVSDGGGPCEINNAVDNDLREAVLSSIENGSELLDTSFLTIVGNDAESQSDNPSAEKIWFDPAHDEIVSEASSRLQLAVAQLLEMLSTTVQQLHEWRSGHSEGDSGCRQSKEQVEELDELRSQLKAEEDARSTLANELNKATALVKTFENQISELHVELTKKDNHLQNALERTNKALARQEELEQNIAEDQRLLEKQKDIIREGLGEHEQLSAPRAETSRHTLAADDQGILDENMRLVKEKRGLQQQGEKARLGLLSRIHELEQAVEELSQRNEEIIEEKQRQTQDLKLQVDALDKQVKANRQFIEEQTVEREQEREEFQKGLQKMKDSIRDKERAIFSQADLSREVESLSEKLKDKEHKCRKLLETKVHLEREVKSLTEAHHSQLEVVKELEGQLDARLHRENELLAQLDELQKLLKHSSNTEESLTNEIEALRAASMSCSSIGHIQFVNDLPKIHSPEMDESHQVNLMQELGLQLHVLEEKLEMRTRELEGLHVSATSSIGSPCSEEISVRDQLSALRNANKEDDGQSFQLSDLRHLEDKADALSRAAEAAARKIRDQDSIIRKQRQVEEEWLQDKDALQHQLNAQLLQISSLQARLEEKRHGFMSATEMLGKISRLQSALQNEQEQSENRLSEVESLNNQLEHVTQQLSAKERELNDYVSRYNEQFGHRESEKISTKKEVDALNAKNKAMEETSLSLQKQVDDLSSLLQTLLKEKNEEIDGLNRQVQEFENNASLLEASKVETFELDRAMSNLKQGLQERDEAVQTLSKDLEQRDVALKELNALLQDKVSTIDILSSQLQHIDSSLKELTNRTDAETREQTSLLEAQNKEMKRIQEIADQRRREVESLKVVLGEKQQLLEQLKTLKDEVSDLTDYQTRLQEDFDTVQGMLEDKHNELIAAHEELSEVLFSSEALHQEKNRLTEELDSSRSQKLLLDKAIADRDTHINILNKRLDEVSNEESVQQGKLRAEILDLREQLYKMENERAKEVQEKCVDASDLTISAHANCQTDFPVVEDELKQQLDTIRVELRDNHQKREFLEAERLMRDSQIARLIDQLESTQQNNQELQEELKSVKLDLEEKNIRVNILEQVQDAPETDVAMSGGSEMNLASVGPVSNLTPSELSAADSESDSLSGESVPTRVKGLMRKVHKEGVQMLTLSEFHFLREHTPPKEDGEVQYTLSVEVEALKDVLVQLMNLLTVLKDSSSNQSEWQQQLLQVISRILVREKQLIMAQLQQDAKSSSADQIQLKTLEEKITSMDIHHQASLRDLARACQSYAMTASSSDTQMAVARERLQHQEEQRKLLQQLSNLEQQLCQRERQMKRRLEMMDFRLEQERLIAEDLRTTLDLEKSRAIELCSQLAQERSLNAQLEVALCQIRAELSNLQSVLDTQCQELTSSRQGYECECTKNQMLQRALDVEKSNFTQLQEVMEAEKRRSRAAQGREQQIIEELRKALENEKDKLLNLTDALEREKLALQTVRKQQEKSYLSKSKTISDDNKNVNESDLSWTTDRTLVTLSEAANSNVGVTSVSELQQWLEIEQRKVRELMHRLEQERNRVATLTETLQQERLRLMEELDIQRSLMQQAKANLNVLQAQKGDLQKEVLKEREHVVLLEADKERLLSMVGTLQEQVRQQEEQCESLRKMQRELNRDSQLKQERNRHSQQDVEMQLNRVQQELQFVQRELDICRKSEKQVKLDLENERKRSDVLSQDWNRLKEIKANGEAESETVLLCKQFADVETIRQKLQLLVIRAKDLFAAGWESSAKSSSCNASLSAILQEMMQIGASKPLQSNRSASDGFTVADLIEKIVQHNSDLVAFIWNLNQEKQALRGAVSQAEEELWKIRQKDPTAHSQQSSVERILAAERAAWTQERTRLQRALYKSEYELSGIKSRISPSGYLAGHESPARAQIQFDDVQINSMYFKYLRSQSFRKNLIHQKQYLLVRLKRLQVSEAHTLEVLDSLGCLPTTAQLEQRQQQQQQQQRSCNRFRSVARAAVAIARMRYLVQRWSRVRAPSAASIYTSSENGIDASSSVHSSRHQRRNPYQVTTPPVRDSDVVKSRPVPRSFRSASEHSASPPVQRALSLQLESPAPSETSLSEFVQRFESLQQQLGISHDITARSQSHT